MVFFTENHEILTIQTRIFVAVNNGYIIYNINYKNMFSRKKSCYTNPNELILHLGVRNSLFLFIC